MPPGITVRPITAEDAPFLFHLFTTTRLDILMLPWSEAQKHEFLQMQFRAQHTDYQTRFGLAQYLIIERNSKPIGRLYVDRRQDRIHILDITILPEERGAGVGSAFLLDLQAEARTCGKAVSLYVEAGNVAQRLYQRLAFRPVRTQGPYVLLEWSALT